MSVLGILNPKGGCGKSTIATNLAVWATSSGFETFVGDLDRQQSLNLWIKNRVINLPKIKTWSTDRHGIFRPPIGVNHAILDTPSSIYNLDLAKLIQAVDFFIVPIGPSFFDFDATHSFLKNLNNLPRIKSGRCKYITVGMRWNETTYCSLIEKYPCFSGNISAIIPENECYMNLPKNGGSIFDEYPQKRADLIINWVPILRWVRENFEISEAKRVHEKTNYQIH